jgi:hypothetical protein
MNTRTQKTIAKEIIYFFSVIVLLILSWGVIEIRNSILKTKINTYFKESSNYKIQIDSLVETFPKKPKAFSDLFRNPVIINQKLPNKNGAFTDIISNWEISYLWIYIIELKFDFNVFTWSDEFGIPVKKPYTKIWLAKYGYEYFEKDILKEFGQERQPNIEDVYTFINAKDENFDCDITDFKFWLEGIPAPPPHKSFEQVEQLKKLKLEADQKLYETNSLLIDKDNIKSYIWFCSIAILTLLYPIRFIYLTIKWALKTVKQEDK